jgi:hypothetical protein
MDPIGQTKCLKNGVSGNLLPPDTSGWEVNTENATFQANQEGATGTLDERLGDVATASKLSFGEEAPIILWTACWLSISSLVG